MVIEAIHDDIFTQTGILETGNYSFYAESVKNLFMSPTFFALDEYGLPFQTVQKLSTTLKPMDNLDDVLNQIASLQLGSLDLTPFEVDLLRELQNTIVR